jgi:hypothetical protein
LRDISILAPEPTPYAVACFCGIKGDDRPNARFFDGMKQVLNKTFIKVEYYIFIQGNCQARLDLALFRPFHEYYQTIIFFGLHIFTPSRWWILTDAIKNLKSGWEEWTEGFIAIPLMIFIPAYQIMNSIILQVKLIN